MNSNAETERTAKEERRESVKWGKSSLNTVQGENCAVIMFAFVTHICIWIWQQLMTVSMSMDSLVGNRMPA